MLFIILLVRNIGCGRPNFFIFIFISDIRVQNASDLSDDERHVLARWNTWVNVVVVHVNGRVAAPQAITDIGNDSSVLFEHMFLE